MSPRISRFTAWLTALLTLGAGPAIAGDVATAEVLGFTADGDTFAFEEHGVQDGSGFAYANRYYIDTASDRFLPGTPVRVVIRDENATVDTARREAESGAQAIVGDDVLADHRGFTAAWNPPTELSADPHRIAINPRPVLPAIDPPLEFRLSEIAADTPEQCRNLGRVKGFRLLRIDSNPGGVTRLVHEDAGIPRSRGCPLGYHLAGVQTYHPPGAFPVFAVLIGVRRLGFEGPDIRYISVTGRL